MTSAVRTIPLRLNDIKTFFREPEIDPFEGESIDLSGIEQIMAAMKVESNWRRMTFRATISLPAGRGEEGYVRQLPQAIQTYCDRHILYEKRCIREIFLEGRRALRVGIVFLLVCVGLSALFEALFSSETLLGSTLSEGLMIAGWVGLWHPCELLLYSWWPHRQEVRLHEKIRAMEIAVEYRPG
ncbi:hypothetical protein [Pseudoxanthobacter sp.]|uniref:hypothetical protein n=1 Tax=Pseudoxanthobacter sp. TaxID=1925742 RepID=UPI002FE3A386